jgi:hypothetical protein
MYPISYATQQVVMNPKTIKGMTMPPFVANALASSWMDSRDSGPKEIPDSL